LTTLGVTFFTNGARVGIAAPWLPAGGIPSGSCAELAAVNASITVNVTVKSRMALFQASKPRRQLPGWLACNPEAFG
jgi:hypothetical protein